MEVISFDADCNDIHGKISRFWLAESKSIYLKRCRRLKLSAENWNWVQKVEIKLINKKVARPQRNEMADRGKSITTSRVWRRTLRDKNTQQSTNAEQNKRMKSPASENRCDKDVEECEPEAQTMVSASRIDSFGREKVLIGSLSKHDVDGSENVTWKCDFAFLQSFF